MTNPKKIVNDMISNNSRILSSNRFSGVRPPDAKCEWCGSKKNLLPLSHIRQGPETGKVKDYVCHSCVVKNWWGGKDPYAGGPAPNW